MTRKHFVAVAKALSALRTFEAEDREMSEVVARAVRYSSVVDAMANVLATSNPKFDRDRFLEACGIVTYESKLTAARKAIENEDQVCFDVAANAGQHFSNVKNTDWFLEAVAEKL